MALQIQSQNSRKSKEHQLQKFMTPLKKKELGDSRPSFQVRQNSPDSQISRAVSDASEAFKQRFRGRATLLAKDGSIVINKDQPIQKVPVRKENTDLFCVQKTNSEFKALQIGNEVQTMLSSQQGPSAAPMSKVPKSQNEGRSQKQIFKSFQAYEDLDEIKKRRKSEKGSRDFTRGRVGKSLNVSGFSNLDTQDDSKNMKITDLDQEDQLKFARIGSSKLLISKADNLDQNKVAIKRTLRRIRHNPQKSVDGSINMHKGSVLISDENQKIPDVQKSLNLQTKVTDTVLPIINVKRKLEYLKKMNRLAIGTEDEKLTSRKQDIILSPESLKKKEDRFRNAYGNDNYVPVREFIKKKQESMNFVSQSLIMGTKRDLNVNSNATTSRNLQNHSFDSPKKSHQTISKKFTSPASPQKYYELGGLGPSTIGTHEWNEAKRKRDQMKQYGERLKQQLRSEAYNSQHSQDSYLFSHKGRTISQSKELLP